MVTQRDDRRALGWEWFGGKLAMTIDWVYAVDGGKIKLRRPTMPAKLGTPKGASSTATIATYLLLGPLGLFAHNFVHGRDVTITPKQTFVVFVDHDVHLVAQRTSRWRKAHRASQCDSARRMLRDAGTIRWE